MNNVQCVPSYVLCIKNTSFFTNEIWIVRKICKRDLTCRQKNVYSNILILSSLHFFNFFASFYVTEKVHNTRTCKESYVWVSRFMINLGIVTTTYYTNNYTYYNCFTLALLLSSNLCIMWSPGGVPDNFKDLDLSWKRFHHSSR